MIHRAQVIAVVEIGQPRPCQIRGNHWNYSQQAEARLVQEIKGETSDTLTLYGGEDFECAQVTWKPGRYLVFLAAQGDGYAGCNWNASGLPIDSQGQVAWMSEPAQRQIDCRRPLSQVIARIRGTL